ncbi:hypothetical protein BDB01DRAFT_850152 [Pilobolus umbonatus]|nr:hypothetical protein BDB01DRAFT_850152 [Pilobolus umbonatus]
MLNKNSHRVLFLFILIVILLNLANFLTYLYKIGRPNLGTPVSWECSALSPSPYNSTKIFIGIFTTKDGHRRRSMIRDTYLQYTSDNIMYKFIVGNQLSPELEEEMNTYNDILPLEVPENMNNGKTYAYFKLMAQIFDENQVDFVLKADDDAYLRLDRLEYDLGRTSRNMSYWGFLVGDTFMGGTCYGLSYDLMKWVASSPIPEVYKRGREDSQVQKWFVWSNINNNIKYEMRNCRIQDHIDSGTCYAKEIDVDNTMIVHYLKKDEHFYITHEALANKTLLASH